MLTEVGYKMIVVISDNNKTKRHAYQLLCDAVKTTFIVPKMFSINQIGKIQETSYLNGK